MHDLEGAGTRALLLDARDAGGLALHAVLASEDDVTVGELLLELRGAKGMSVDYSEVKCVMQGLLMLLSQAQRDSVRKAAHLASKTTLNLVPGLDLGDGHEDDNSLATALDIHLASSRNLKGAELCLEIGRRLEVEDGLGDELLSLGGRGARSVGRAEDLGGLMGGGEEEGVSETGRRRRRAILLGTAQGVCRAVAEVLGG